MSEWITRDQARNHFRKCGLTYRDVKRAHIYLLLSLLDTEFEASRNNPESSDNVSPRINDKIIYVPSYENGSEIGMQDAYLYMKGAYFSERECISFNLNGFIGFAGWASNGNAQPILRAFIRWCDILAERHDHVDLARACEVWPLSNRNPPAPGSEAVAEIIDAKLKRGSDA